MVGLWKTNVQSDDSLKINQVSTAPYGRNFREALDMCVYTSVNDFPSVGGTNVREITRDLATLPQGESRSL